MLKKYDSLTGTLINLQFSIDKSLRLDGKHLYDRIEALTKCSSKIKVSRSVACVTNSKRAGDKHSVVSGTDTDLTDPVVASTLVPLWKHDLMASSSSEWVKNRGRKSASLHSVLSLLIFSSLVHTLSTTIPFV